MFKLLFLRMMLMVIKLVMQANVNDLKPNSTWKFKAMYIGSEKNVTFKTEELKVSGF